HRRDSLSEFCAGGGIEFPKDSSIAPISLSQLRSWTELDSQDARYFSGTATYRQVLDVQPKWLDSQQRIYLDMGRVDDIAAVSINGKRAGVLWRAPYQAEISSLLKPGRNEIAIEVTNLWVNRLIGDAQPGAAQHTFTTGPTYKADAPLRPSGLQGPVQ